MRGSVIHVKTDWHISAYDLAPSSSFNNMRFTDFKAKPSLSLF